MRYTVLKYFLFVFMCLGIFLMPHYIPFVEKHFPNMQARQLSGQRELYHRPAFAIKKYLNKSFQRSFENHIKTESGIANIAVRGKNQVDFSFFNHINSSKIIVGKEDYFFSTEYCEAYLGKDFIGEKNVKRKVTLLKKVCDSLNKKGIQCIVLNPPGKPRALPEYLPDYYQNYPYPKSNWSTFNAYLDEEKIPRLDLGFLLDSHTGTKLELYPKFGLHWNYLGATLAAEELCEFVSTNWEINCPKMSWELIMKEKAEILSTDIEMMNGANLWSDLSSPKMPYPRIKYLSDSLTVKPNVLVVGDSYYKIFLDYGVQKGLFASASSFYYYYQQVYPKRKNNPSAQQLDIIEEIKNRDLIIFSHSESNLEKFGFGYLEKLAEALSIGGN